MITDGAAPLIRAAERRDLPRIVELIALGSLVPSTPGPHDLTSEEDAWDAVNDGPNVVLVAEVDGTVVAACQVVVFRHLQHQGGWCAEIESVHVHPDHRGRGVGHALMRSAIDRARDLGCYRVQLTSNEARTEAHRFYESLGFAPSHVGFKLALR